MLLLRLGVRGTMILGLAAWTAAMTILTIGRPLGLVIGSLGFNGLFVSGFLVAGQVFINRHAGDSMRASVQALLSFVNGSGMLFGHLLVGYLRSVHGGATHLAFQASAVISASLLLLFLLGFREADSSEPLPRA